MGAPKTAGCGEAIFEYSVSRALFRKRMGNGRSTNGNQCARRKKGAIMFDPGSTGFMILGAMLVFLMTPALGIFLWRPFSPQKCVEHHVHVNRRNRFRRRVVDCGRLVVRLRRRPQLSVLRRFRPDFLRGAAR